MADYEPEGDAFEAEVDLDTIKGELWIDPEGGYVHDVVALCREFNILAMSMREGVLIAYVPYKGDIPLGELLKSMKPKGAGSIRAIKPA